VKRRVLVLLASLFLEVCVGLRRSLIMVQVRGTSLVPLLAHEDVRLRSLCHVRARGMAS
jgi:hypothetical protein